MGGRGATGTRNSKENILNFKGSEKQIKWAKNIVEDYIESLDIVKRYANGKLKVDPKMINPLAKYDKEKIKDKINNYESTLKQLGKEKASYIIDNRFDIQGYNDAGFILDYCKKTGGKANFGRLISFYDEYKRSKRNNRNL